MSVNFYNNAGLMAWYDVHVYQPEAPGPPVPWAHFVSVTFSWPSALYTKRIPSVTSMAEQMIKGGFDIYTVPHGPLGTPPGVDPSFPFQLAKVHALSGTKAQLTVHSVTNKGDSLACCVADSLGTNINCNDPVDAPTGRVFQFNSVQTEPSLGDYVGAVVGYMLDAGLGFAVGFGVDKIGKKLGGEVLPLVVELIVKHFVRRMPEALGDWADVSGLVGKWAQKTIDGER